MNEAQRRTALDPVGTIRQRLARLAAASRASLAWERLWPRLWLPAAVVLTFLAVSWFGLWTHLPWQVRAIGLVVFLGALAASLWHVAITPLPTRRDALNRLDQSLEGGHRPASALEDSLAVGSNDPVSQALWKLHVERQSARIAGLKVALPQPLMAGRDRFALRAVPLLAAVTAFFVAGHEAIPRLTAAFDWRGPAAAAPAIRIDAWIDPPAYTRLPPILIDFARLQGSNFSAPEKSTVVVRIAGQSGMDVTTTGRLDVLPPPDAKDGAKDGAKPAAQPATVAVLEKRYMLAGNGTLRITGSGAPHATLNLTAIADQPPQISFVEPPKAVSGVQGGLSLSYRAKDDYGIAAAEVLVSRAGPPSTGRSLVEPPKQSLTVPSSPTGEEDLKSTVDFSAHPWAGAKVKMTLLARDEAGQEGRSEATEVTLPQRTFTKPLAKALVEQRRKLVMDVDTRKLVQLAMDALMIEPNRFMKEAGVYLGMRMITEGLRRANTDDQLREVADQMWTLALQLEDGDLSDAERQLRAAQERLQQALERGASEEEIRKLTEDMRRALDNFMREFAQQMQRQQQNTQQNQAQLPENFRTVTPRDLQNMLNRIEELSKRGDMAEAQRLMEELNNLLNNLQMARPGQQDPRQREMNQALGDLDKLTREQQELRDQTYQQEQQRQNRTQRGQRPGQQQARPGQRQQGQQGQRGQRGQQQPGQQQPGQDGEEGEGEDGQNAEQGQGQGQGLSQRQQALRERLEELQRRMRGMGAQQPGELGEAEDAMREAEGQLGQGQGEGALDSQGRALDALRRGGQNLAQQMQPGGEPGEGEGTDNAYGEPDGRQPGRPSAQQRTREDPLGRPQRQRDFADGRVRVPGADESATQRARRILEELRRRLGDPSRPMEELDYLERLLRRN
ncbi:TIGR02302 family protein [Bosea caraganae]|uniref:TIGR02302 family protein n=1 Tax=Bosea caraganae TaxID=2763117 RepID=A0A370LAH2_9HYPH|nr:TIGR02302 family protein [Bosea caraganae]RDJ21668.1 TIGR02302 family protein [Bosea caraganae]RDJ28302.1 TIGR02302 family protein [Bosea caraganae]